MHTDLSQKVVQRYGPLLVWCMVIAALFLIPLRITGYGYLPGDDALRHAAKAISGKAWSDIVVLREDITIDQHHGWHALLGGLHRSAGFDGDDLVTFSVILLFWLFAFSALPWQRRPEIWIAVLLILNLISNGLFYRLHLGRPYIVSMAVFVMVLSAWTRGTDRDPVPRTRLIWTTLLLAVSAWLHGSWYLFALPVAAFVLSGQWRKGAKLLACWAIGTVAGAAATGQPVAYLFQQFKHMLYSMGQPVLERFLVTEFRPFNGWYIVVLTMAFVLYLQVQRRKPMRSLVFEPLFLMAAIGWLLGFKVSRFWTDWGLPAAMLWMTRELSQVWESTVPRASAGRLASTAFVCAALFLSVTSDYGDRWTSTLTAEYLTPENPDVAEWLPDPGGIVYSHDMGAFYRTFYKNPHAPWKYILGFEPSLMPEEDQATFRKIQWNHYADEACQPWVDKMRPEDRFIMLQSAGRRPTISELEWYYAASDTWIGRLPRGKSDVSK